MEYYKKGDYVNARNYFEKAVSLAPIEEKSGLSYANVLWNLGLAYTYLGQYDKAEPAIKEVVEYRKDKYGSLIINYVKALQGLAQIYYYRRKFKEAEDVYN
jgi:tetratricopeptide (TPR) repeat protein